MRKEPYRSKRTKIVSTIELALILLLLIFFNVTCGESYSVYSTKYRVNFYYSLNLSPLSLSKNSGFFVSVYKSIDQLKMSSNTGVKSDFPLSETEKVNFRLGLGGLIIGTPQLDNFNSELWAYDLACPICENAKYRLSVDNTGIATCGSCKTQYDLNNNGYVIYSEKEKYPPLFRYPVTINGSMVIVAN
ncbi:MAG TPA: hypothetical protein VFC94_06605 [Bacteroidaceae bacterium]|nr:hypothetical protein [Bacteroidaceae bacterium]